MKPKKSTACILKVRHMERNPILALGTSENDVQKYERLASFFGSVSPCVVARSEKGYRVLSGQAKLDALDRNGMKEIPAIVAETGEETEQMKLSLMLSTIREEGGAISEGIFIDRLISSGVQRRELIKLLGKSKSWLSKRQALATNLAEAVKGMVADGCLCPRSTEEIAKLPPEMQTQFAANVVRDQLSKTNVEQLVRLFRDRDTSEIRCQMILEDPLTALPKTLTKTRRSKGPLQTEQRLISAVRYAIRQMNEIKGLVLAADKETLGKALPKLDALSAAIADISTVIRIRVSDIVSPGEQEASIKNDN